MQMNRNLILSPLPEQDLKPLKGANINLVYINLMNQSTVLIAQGEPHLA